MKAFNKRLFSALLTMGMLGMTGCGPDNEGEGQKLATKAGDPGKPNPDAIPKEKTTPPRTDAERAQRGPQGTQGGGGTQKGYPGAKQ